MFNFVSRVHRKTVSGRPLIFMTTFTAPDRRGANTDRCTFERRTLSSARLSHECNGNSVGRHSRVIVSPAGRRLCEDVFRIPYNVVSPWRTPPRTCLDVSVFIYPFFTFFFFFHLSENNPGSTDTCSVTRAWGRPRTSCRRVRRQTGIERSSGGEFTGGPR